MKEEVLFEISSLSRNPLKVKGFRFGREGTVPSCVIVGPMMGNAIDQLWVASQLVRFLRQQELANAALLKVKFLLCPQSTPTPLIWGRIFGHWITPILM